MVICILLFAFIIVFSPLSVIRPVENHCSQTHCSVTAFVLNFYLYSSIISVQVVRFNLPVVFVPVLCGTWRPVSRPRCSQVTVEMWWVCHWLQTHGPSSLGPVMPQLSFGTSETACADRRSSGMSQTSTLSVWVNALLKQIHITFPFHLFCPPSLSSSPAAVRLQLVRMTPPAGCLTCVRIRSCVYTLMIISSVASPLWPSPALAVCCSLATMTLTATSGTPWRETEQVNILALLFCGCTVTSGLFVNCEVPQQ